LRLRPQATPNILLQCRRASHDRNWNAICLGGLTAAQLWPSIIADVSEAYAQETMPKHMLDCGVAAG